MLEILHNDLYSNLNFAINLNDECVMIIDDDLKKHFEISFNPWEPEDEQLIDEWTKAVRKYYHLDDNIQDNLTAWREAQVERSIRNFRNYLAEQHNPYKPDFYKTVKDLARYYVFDICEDEERTDFLEDNEEVDRICEYAYKWFSQNNSMNMWEIIKTIMHFELEEGMAMCNVEAFQKDLDDYICYNF